MRDDFPARRRVGRDTGRGVLQGTLSGSHPDDGPVLSEGDDASGRTVFRVLSGDVPVGGFSVARDVLRAVEIEGSREEPSKVVYRMAPVPSRPEPTIEITVTSSFDETGWEPD